MEIPSCHHRARRSGSAGAAPITRAPEGLAPWLKLNVVCLYMFYVRHKWKECGSLARAVARANPGKWGPAALRSLHRTAKSVRISLGLDARNLALHNNMTLTDMGLKGESARRSVKAQAEG